MIYVFDTSSMAVMDNYYEKTFKSFWLQLNQVVSSGELISVREVLNELQTMNNRPRITKWALSNRKVFVEPDEGDQKELKKILSYSGFRALVSKKSILKGSPVADPFVIAAASSRGGTVVVSFPVKRTVLK